MLFENIRELYRLYKMPINLTLLVVGISFIIYIFINYKIVIFTAEGNTTDMKVYGYDIKTVDSNTQKPTELAVSSINIVPRSVNYFEAVNDKQATIIGEHALPFYVPFQNFTITLASQKKLEKEYTGPFNCMAGDNQNLYSYSCTNPDHIFNYQTASLPWSSMPTTNIKNERSLVHYKDGLLGIRHLPGIRYDKPLVYTDLKKKSKTNFALPQELSASIINTSSIIPNDDNSNLLLIASHNAKAFYVVNINNTTVVKKIDYPKEYEANDGISCRIHNATATCFIGKSTKSLDSHDEDEAEVAHQYHDKKSTLLTFALEGDSQPTSQLLDSDLYIKEIFKTNDGLYGLSDNSLLLKLHTDGTSSVIARDVQSVGVADNLFFTRSNQLYTLKENSLTSQLAFESENNVSRVQSLNDAIYVSMFATNNIGQTTNSVYTYRLTDTDGDNKQALAILSLNKLPDVQSVDYNGNDIFINLKMPIVSDKATGKTIYNAKLRQAAISRIDTEINKLPIKKADYRIIYYPTM